MRREDGRESRAGDMLPGKDDGGLEAELEFLLRHAGHRVPEDRMAGMIAGYRDLKVMLDLLRQPRTAANEPANVYRLETITRSA